MNASRGIESAIRLALLERSAGAAALRDIGQNRSPLPVATILLLENTNLSGSRMRYSVSNQSLVAIAWLEALCPLA